MSEKCIGACDELILWFGDGPYVERALELKMLYQPLTRQQEEKYREIRQERTGVTQIGAEEMKKAGEYEHEAVEIPQVNINPERFNTVNLQEEIAKGMQQILDATEKETVSDTMDNIKKMVEEISYLQLPREEEEEEESLFITSPIVGTFYSAAAPDVPAFVKVGDQVKAGQTVCILEAMKLMNEIQSDYDCEIEAVLVSNEQKVEYGQPLFRVKRL